MFDLANFEMSAIELRGLFVEMTDEEVVEKKGVEVSS